MALPQAIVLVDSGYAGNDGRDPGRVMAAAKAAGIKKIDYLLIAPYHADRLGGAPELSTLIPIGTLSIPTRRHRRPPLSVVSHIAPTWRCETLGRSHGRETRRPDTGEGSRRPGCEQRDRGRQRRSPPAADEPAVRAAARPPGEPLENPRSTGVHLRFGRFRFLDLGNLTGTPLYSLSARRTG